MPFRIKIRYYSAFAWSILGILIGGYVGYLVQTLEGLGGYKGNTSSYTVFLGCFVGWVFALIVAFYFHGIFEYWSNRAAVTFKPMEWQRFQATGVQSWDLYLTLHRVQNVFNAEQMNLFSSSSVQFMYLDVEVGRLVRNDYFSVQLNKPMRTCVQQSGVFEENFRANISPTDNTIRITLYSQGVVRDTVLGICDISITDQVVNAGFPQKKVFNLLHNATEQTVSNTDQLAGSCIVSFAPGENMSEGAVNTLEAANKLQFEHMRSQLSASKGDLVNQSGTYGAWATGNTSANYGATGTQV